MSGVVCMKDIGEVHNYISFKALSGLVNKNHEGTNRNIGYVS